MWMTVEVVRRDPRLDHGHQVSWLIPVFAASEQTCLGVHDRPFDRVARINPRAQVVSGLRDASGSGCGLRLRTRCVGNSMAWTWTWIWSRLSVGVWVERL